MDAPQSFLKEMKKYSVVRPTTWQGPSARGGVKVDITSILSSKEEASNGTDVTMNEQANISSSLWTRLSNATGSTTHGAAVVRLMQKHLLENVDNIPLDEIELLASGEIDRSTELSIGVAPIAGSERNVMTVAFCHPSRLVFNPLSVIQTCRPAIQSSHPLFLPSASRRRQAQSQCQRTTIHAAQNAPHGRTTVGAVIIGNEILNGKTIDKNLSTLAIHVESYGAVLEQAVTIRDDVDIIAEHVRQMSSAYDLVFTSGGIGPTLDDVTYAGVAAAFSLPLDRHAETIKRMKQSRPDFDLNTARLRMAELPVDCDVLWTPDLWVPLAVVRNVYILPGIPKLFHRMLMSVPTQRFGTRERRAKKVVLCEMAEGDLAELLESVAEQYDVSLGSYPATTTEARKRYKSMITLEGDETDVVDKAAEVIKSGVNGRYEQQV